MVEYAGVRRNVMTTLSLTFVMLAMMTTTALGYTIDGDLSDWGVDLTGDWSVNDTWVPNGGVKFIVEDNENGYGVHIIGKGSNYAAYCEPQIQLSTGTWTNEPFMGERYDLEAMYIDEDSNNIYIALVTSLNISLVPSADPEPGDLALNLDGDAGTGGYGYEYGIRLTEDKDSVEQWHIYRTLADENWNVPNTVPMNKPNILNANNPGAENGTIEGIYFGDGVYPPYDNYKPNWVIEMAIPKDNVGLAGKNLQEAPLPKVIYYTNLCGNDKLVWDMGMYAAIGDYVWEDTNRNGIQDTGEPGIEGVTVDLYTCDGTYVATTTTNVSGYYLFDNLVPGEYYVEFVAPAGYSFTLPDEGTDDAIDSDANETTGKTICTTLEPGEKDLSWDAGLYKPACMVEVQKFCSVVLPTTPFVCSDAKPIDSLTMIWDGDKNISEITVYRDKYDPKEPAKNLMDTIGGPIRKGDTVTATAYVAADAKNDVDWLITFEDGTTGISRFHRSCSDEDMNGPEDCGKYEGNAKSTDAKFINLWLFEGMAGNGLTLDCTPEEPELNEDCTVCAPQPGSCDDDKPTALVFEYTGEACSATTNFQDGKFKCEPTDVPLGALADVVMTKDADTISVEIDGNTTKIFRSDTVGKEFPSEIKYVITDTDGNAQSQTLHTSCSKPLNVGDQFGSLILRDFIPKGGSIPEANVIYTYRINNTGTENVIVNVVDNLLGDIANNLLIMGGELVEFTEEVVLTEIGNITNTVNVTDTTDPDCFATDKVTVQVLPPPPPPFECDGKIVELTMIWNGTQTIRVKAWKGNVGSTLLADRDNVNVGDEVTIQDYAGAPNDVIWELYYAGTEDKLGESKFHLSCSDKEMNGPEDCGKPQGDGKKNEDKYMNDWLLEGLVDSAGGVLDCTA